MKRRFFILPTGLLLLWLLTAPSLAASEYGVLYDETDLLWSEELEHLAVEILPKLTATYDIDLHVDILTDLDDDTDLASFAAQLYQVHGYGSPHGGNGVTLTLLVHIDEDGVTLDNWHPYAAGESWELTSSATWNICRNADTWLTAEAWDGDLSQDIEALTGAVADMAEGLEQFVLAGGVHSTIWSPLTQSLLTEQTSELSEENTPTDTEIPKTTAKTESPEVQLPEVEEEIKTIPNEPTVIETDSGFFHPAMLLLIPLFLFFLWRRIPK